MDPIFEIEKSTGYFQSSDGTSIYFEERGKGEAIIFVYGIACLMNHFHHQLDYFSSKYRAVGFDYRGHHSSEIPKDLDKLTVDFIAHDIYKLLDHLKLEKAIFVGHSFGVQALLKTYEYYPQIFSSLVFINGFASDPIKKMFGTDVFPKIFEIAKESHQVFPEGVASIWRWLCRSPLAPAIAGLSGGFNLSQTSFKDIEVYARGVGSLELEVFLRLFESMMNYDGTSTLRDINCPTMIISGERDGVTPAYYQKQMHDGIKNSEFHSVAYGSHCTQLDFPEYVNLLIEKFLDKTKHGPHATRTLLPAPKPRSKSKPRP